MRFDPRDHGARCDECPLGPNGELRKEEWQPVGPEIHPGATVLAVAEAPGPDEVIHGRPLVGRAGGEWGQALAACGKRRTDVDLDNVICCKPPGQSSGAWRRLDKDVDKLNRKRVKAGKEAVPHPVTCCRPRLIQSASEYSNIITMGKTATAALTGLGSSIQATRGGPIRLDREWDVTQEVVETRRKALPMLHPSFILRSPGWRHVLHADLGKAFRWFKNQLRWADPETLWRPTPAELEEWLAQPAPFWAYDVETDGIEALECKMRTLAIAIPDLDDKGRAARDSSEQVCRAVGLSFLSVDGRSRLYHAEDEAKVKAILRRAFTDGRVWVGHNAGYYDRMVIEHHFGVTPYPMVDTLFPARFRAPDLPKGLKTIGSILTDVERWETTEKGTKIATGSENDDELLRYNIVDTVVNARIVVPLIDAATQAGAFRPLNEALKPKGWAAEQPWNLNQVDHVTQEMCVEMHKNGVWVDQEARSKLENKYTASVEARFKNLQSLVQSEGLRRLSEAAASEDELNPGSADQIRTLLYSRWKLGIPPQMDSKDFYTESGMPGTGDAVLRGHLASGLLSQEQEAFVRELRLYRREKNKILGTVLIPMRRRDMDPKKGLVHEDGRVRSGWNSHVTSVGRLSSSGPNLQNIGNRKGQGPLKTIFAAQPGHVLVGADLDQAHLRIIANYWKIPLLMECFNEGKDPHNTLAYTVFGDKFKSASGWGPDGFSLYKKPGKGDAKSMRDIAKTFRYASIYAANPATVWQVLTSTETDDSRLPYVGMTLREVRYIHDRWMESEPEWGQAWDAMMNTFRHQNYMEEPIMGRSSGPLSDGKLNEVVNFPILAAEGSVMRLAEHAVREAFPFQKWGPGTGMIHQCHDSIAVEVPEAIGEESLKLLEECMTVSIPGWDVVMSAEGGMGKTLKDV